MVAPKLPSLLRVHAAVDYAVKGLQPGRHLSDLMERLKSDDYRARLVRRHDILKVKGKQRPLGISSTED